MHRHSLEQWQHAHDFNIDTTEGERKTRLVVVLTACMMVIEVTAGYVYGSMALLADGWHMGTHVAALAISVFAYRYARLHAENPHYSFGTGKVSALGGFASAIALAVVALLMGMESVHRLLSPQAIHFNEAILVAVIGLVVNLVSAWLLQDGHHHAHHHPGQHTHQDHNLRAAYLHVLADALTSVLAIIALITGKYLGWIWLDACMGLVGAALITRWGYGLMQETSGVLLDSSPGQEMLTRIRRIIESDADNQIADLHVWRVGPRDFSAIVSLVTHHPRDPQYYKTLLGEVSELGHVTIEVNHCTRESCRANT